MEHLTIGEVARRTGLRASALRYYESIGLLPEPERVNGRRRYTADAVQTVTLIQFARKTGFTLAETRRLFEERRSTAPFGKQRPALFHQKLAQLDELIKHAQHMKSLLERGLECECRQVNDCVILDRAWWDQAGATDEDARKR